jgi:putative PEP-CTERM system histidine kinase
VLDRPSGLAQLSFEDRDLLKTAGRQIAAYLAQYDADSRLAEARQFEAYNRMTAFVMHDLKNIAAQLRLISQNADRHKRNPEFVDDAVRTISNSAARMTKLIAQLTTGETGTMRTIDLADLAERAAVRRSMSQPVPQVVVSDRPTVFADAERLAAVIEHAISNAQEATPPTGEVRIEVNRTHGHPMIAIVDTGCGMDDEFVRERLFRPFDTTKGTKGMGIGAFQIREYLRSLGGGVQVDSVPGAGTRFTLIFPNAQLTAARLTG